MVKTALVTGSAGFLGRHFTAELRARGWQVEGCDPRTSIAQNALGLFRVSTRVYDLVVHCAAVDPHRAAIDGHPIGMAANIELDAAMFGWAVRTQQRRVLYISSSAAYPIALQRGPETWDLHEDDISLTDPDEPDAGYGWSKLTGERMAAAAAAAGLPVHVVRPFSGYGPDQGPNWPFGAFIARATARVDPFTIWGDGQQVRDWIHVDDVIAGALAVVDADCRQPVNLCTGQGTSMSELARLCCEAVGYTPEVELRLDKPAGVAYRVGDPTRLHGIYVPRVDLFDGVKRALA